MSPRPPSLIVVVGSGGVGKTTLAAALGIAAARGGDDTLVMTFDPSRRLKDALGVGDEAAEREVEVPCGAPAALAAHLLDPRRTFDQLVTRYAPDAASRDRILHNRFYDHLSGTLAGVLEYMAVERLFEVARAGRHARVVLDTPPTRQALDFLEAPERLIGFLDSGALRVALKPWFDERGRLRPTSHLGLLGRGVEALLDRVVGLDVLRDMAEFFQAFAPLYGGFRERAREVQALLRAPETLFLLVCRPDEEAIPDAMFFARRLRDAGHRLGPLLVNRVHPRASARRAGTSAAPRVQEAGRLLAWLEERDRRGLASLRTLLASDGELVEVPLLGAEPSDTAALGELASILRGRLPADVL
ncbi:MAG TPA: ArsA-related P-loop ATPase [Thermoanaerobaculaceae bacterium]|nr:ArsA-related P-loop ATPase [Thermoanaerobaculaceae bacterium]